jgi:tetratricopeptide (TPR) repeat protein
VKLAAIILLGLVLFARIAAAEPTDAERFYTEGQAAYDDKRYDDAIASWQKAYDLSHLSALVFNLAQAYRLKGDCTKAVETYQRFIKLDPTSPQRGDAEGRLIEIQPCPVEKPVVVEPPPQQLPPKIVAPVEHGGRGKKIAGYVVGILGVALVGGGAYFGSRAQSLASDVNAACSTGHCEWTSDLASKDSDGRSAEKLQWIGYGVGAAAVITGALLVYLGSREHAPPITVAARPDGAAVSWTGSW